MINIYTEFKRKYMNTVDSIAQKFINSTISLERFRLIGPQL